MKKEDIYTDSHKIAKDFHLKNNYVKRKIEKIMSDIVGLKVEGANPLCEAEDREYRGQKFTAHVMNRDFFMLLMMNMNGKDVTKWMAETISKRNIMEGLVKKYEL